VCVCVCVCVCVVNRTANTKTEFIHRVIGDGSKAAKIIRKVSIMLTFW